MIILKTSDYKGVFSFAWYILQSSASKGGKPNGEKT